MKTISAAIYLPQKEEIYERVAHVVVPSDSGEADIYPDHAECYLLIHDGDVRIVDSGGVTTPIHVVEGGCYFSKNHFVLFVAA